MSTCIVACGASALAYWWKASKAQAVAFPSDTVWIGSDVYRPLRLEKNRQLGEARGIGPYVASIKAELGLSESMKLDLLVRDAGSRTRASGVWCHVYKGALPPDSLCKVREGLYVTSPELTFVQMAAFLPRPDLIELGYELCGAYTYDDDGGYLGCSPICDTNSLGRLLSELGNVDGIASARWALSRICDNSGSQRETQSAMLLSLSRKLGGQAMGLPVMNRSVGPDAHSYVPDMLWPGVAVDYDGSSHDDPASVARDKMRRNAIQTLGIGSFVLLKEHFRSYEAFEAAADQIRKIAGMKRARRTVEQRGQARLLFDYITSPARQQRLLRLRKTGVYEKREDPSRSGGA